MGCLLGENRQKYRDVIIIQITFFARARPHLGGGVCLTVCGLKVTTTRVVTTAKFWPSTVTNNRWHGSQLPDATFIIIAWLQNDRKLFSRGEFSKLEHKIDQSIEKVIRNMFNGITTLFVTIFKKNLHFLNISLFGMISQHLDFGVYCHQNSRVNFVD